VVSDICERRDRQTRSSQYSVRPVSIECRRRPTFIAKADLLYSSPLTWDARIRQCMHVIGTARIVCRAGSMKRYCVRSSVPAWAHRSKPKAVGSLLCCGPGDRSTGAAATCECGQCHVSAYVGSCFLLHATTLIGRIRPH